MSALGRILIIGAGPTGLGAAWRLKELGHDDFLIYEATDKAGGLASSFTDPQGFTWDVGGHVQFSHYTYFDNVMDQVLSKSEWLHHERESWVWMRDRFIPYPFQYNIRYLPADDLKACLDGLAALSSSSLKKDLQHFKDWILASFGKGIADHFMIPYNFKVWAYPADQLTFKWIGERVAVVDYKRVLENIDMQRDDRSWGPNNTFRFPLKGGTGVIWERTARMIGLHKIRFSSRVTSVDSSTHTAQLSDGKEDRFDILLNTSPLDRFCSSVVDYPTDLKELAKGLVHSSTHIIGIGLRGQPKKELASKCWMYFPESNCPFYRVTVFSNYSPNNVPDHRVHWSLMAEVSESPVKPVNPDTILEETIQGLLETQLISSRDEIISQWHLKVNYGYPTPSLHRDEILEKVNRPLEERNLFSRGRFGAWKYEVSNQDHSFMQGVEWVNKLKAIANKETTFCEPEFVNSGTKK